MHAELSYEQVLELNKEIWSAVWDNNLNNLRDLLRRCPRDAINHKHDSGKTALHTAALLTHIDCAKMLLEHGADVNIDNIDRMTALHFASYSSSVGDPKFRSKKKQKEARGRQVEMVRILLNAGANPLKASVRGETAEFLAMENDMPEVTSLLKEESIKYKLKLQDLDHRHNYNALRKTAEAGDIIQFTGILTKDMKSLNERCPMTGQTLLYLASCSGQFEIVSYIISMGGSDLTDGQSVARTLTPLHIACQKGFTSIVRLLMEKQPSYVKYFDAEGRTPLHDACKYGYVDIVHYLLTCASPVDKFGPNSTELLNTVTGELHSISPASIGKYINPINADRRLKQSPLHDAAESGNLEIVHLLLTFLEKGTVRDIDLSSKFSIAPRSDYTRTMSPLSSPVHQRRFDKQASLTSSNGRPLIAGIDSVSRSGYTPFHLAARRHHYAVCDELLSAGAHLNAIIRPDLNKEIDVDYTLLVAAAHSNDLGLVRYLLSRGATDDRNRALRRTIRNNFVEAAGLLLSYSHGVQVSPNDQSCDYYSSEKESHLLDIVWQHKELTMVHPEWIHSVLKENMKSPISSVLITLDVSRNKLTALPYEIFELSNLIEFDASHNELAELPSSPPLQQQKLVSSQDGSVIEDGRWSCTRLRKLNVSNNKLTELPSHIFNLPSLEELRASNNSISKMPTRMWNSPNLSNIYLDHNEISQLPNPTPLNLSEESNLEDSVRGDKVVLSPSPQHNPLLPNHSSSSIIHSSVNSLSESYNSYGLPICIEHTSIRFSTSKTERWLNTLPPPNKRGQFPATIDRKMQQKRVQSRKGILEDPDSTELDIPQKSRASKESNLTTLSLNYNRLHSLPPALACYAPTLKKLYVAHNLIRQLGVVHDFPPNLEILDASSNQLSECITPSLSSGTYKDNACYSPHTQTVTVLDDQELICPHRIHKTLRKLSTLKLSRNDLTAIILFRLPLKQNAVGLEKSQEDTNEGGSATDLYSYGTAGTFSKSSHGSGSSGSSGHGAHHQTSKDSGFSMSTSVPRDLKDQSRELTEVAPPLYPELSNLDISHNKLKFIPHEIAQIHTLGCLNVSYNELVDSLPLELCRLDNLFQLDYSGMDLLRPSVSDLDKFHRTTDKLNFMRALMESSAKNYKMKLMLVGLQKQGKTTLLNRLREVSEKGSIYNPIWSERTNSLYYSQTPQDSGLSAKEQQLSTVGVDLGEWRYSKDLPDGHLGGLKSKFSKPNKVNPTITFYTWDFAGQEEYYATHQCFLTYRSLYLLLWNTYDDKNGIKNLSFWLHNIQSRAPGSPVIIIGTHVDKLGNTQQERDDKKVRLERYIKETYLVGRSLHELEEHGLPVIKDVFFVAMPPQASKTEGILELRKHIYDIAMMLSPNERRGRVGKSGEQKLLDQPVPAKYIKLEECVHMIRRFCRENSKTPVMNVQEFREHTRNIITEPADLQHAVTYLHENGVLLHYNTPTLEHLYFVDPQWLVDMLAHIVTVPEVNRYIMRGCQQSGILRVTNMSHIFRGQMFPSTYQSEYIELLGRFEVALALNPEQLLIPSFLPDTPRYTIHWYRTKFPRPAIRDVVQEYLMDEQHSIPLLSSNDPIPEIPHLDQSSGSNSSNDTSSLLKEPPHTPSAASDTAVKLKYTGLLLRRFYFMLYMPSGFWPRLISRMMSNNSILELIRELLGHSLDDSEEEVDLNRCYESCARPFMTVVGHSKLNWSYWKTGIELWIGGKSVLRVSEIIGSDFYQHCSGSPNEASEEAAEKPKSHARKYEVPTLSHASTRQDMHFKTGVGPIDPCSDTTTLLFVFGGCYTAVNSLKRKGLEILIPDMICLSSNSRDTSQEGSWTSAKLLARVVDFIDALLEDWFPGLGARNLLPDDSLPKVVRLVPCPLCIGLGQGTHTENKSRIANSGIRKKIGSSKRVTKKDDRVQTSITPPSISFNSYAFLIEELVYTSKTSQFIECPNHKRIPISDLSPDLVFADIQYMVLDPSSVDRNKYIDSGGFGDIFYGFLYRNPTGDVTAGDPGEEIAIKVQANSEMKGEGKNDDRHICMGGYLSMRAELSILESLDHPHIIRVLGLLLNPYSMLVEWAPLGSLHSILTTYWENNLSIQPHVLHNTVSQVAEGLAYLHRKEIIYYDLKSPNILAFNFPTVQFLKNSHGTKYNMDLERGLHSFNSQDDEKIPILVKVADMGISRYSVLGKSKGFRGTPGFMAPEILKFHGAETCDCKVDVFSMGMFLYELIAGHFPYEYQNLMDGQIEKLIVSGERPPLQKREITNPFFYLNCMRWCWQDDPRSRPSSTRLVDVLSNPSLPRLIDAFPLGISNPVSAVCLCVLPQSMHSLLTLSSSDFSEPRSPDRKSSLSTGQQGESREEIWICFKNERMGQATVVSFQEHSYLNIETVHLCQSRIKCLCAVKDTVWVCSEGGDLYVYQASTHKQLFERTLVIPGYEEYAENEITDIVYYQALCTVVVSTFSGAILCFEDQPSESEECDCRGFSKGFKCFLPVKNVVKLDHYVNTIIAIPTRDDDTFQVWCGCLQSTVAVINVKDYTFTSPEYLQAPFSKGDTPDEGYVHHLAHTLSYSRQHLVWSLLNPSSILQCWDAEDRRPIPEKEYRFCDYKEDPVQSMLAFEEYIYLGTLNGRIYIFDTQKCTIKCELQGHDKTVYSLIRMNGIVQPGYWVPRILGKTLPRQREISHKRLDRVYRHRPVIVSIGTGFKDLVDRAQSSFSLEEDSRDTFMLAWLGEYSIGTD